MVLRWIHVATLVVVTLTVIHCEASSPIQKDISNDKVKDLCPCLPVHICPRVFGTKPEDAKYLGDIMKCEDDNMVRCCGASASFVVGMGKANTTPEPNVEVILPTTQAPQPDILSRLNPDVHENEIPLAENESDEFTTASDWITEAPGSEETQNIDNFHQKHINEDDEEPAESESITETTSTQFQQGSKTSDENVTPTDVEESSTVVVTTEKQRKYHRKPKNLDDDVIKVYPNFMSGIPKTTPKNMPDTNEMKNYFDQDIGMDLHLVFSQTTLKPELSTETASAEEKNDVDPTSTVSSSSKPSRFKFAKRRRQYRPIQKHTTEAPLEDMELLPTTVSNTNSKVRTSNLRPRPQNSTDAVTKSLRTNLGSNTPTTQEEEILHTSDDDESHRNRFRLFNARHRLNYLQRTTTTTELPVEMSTRHITQSKPLDNRRPSRVNETSNSRVLVNRRPAKMNETLIRFMDNNHRNMISRVRVALKAATTENRIVEIPRSFANADIDRQIKKMEEMLASKMVNVYTEIKSKRRGQRPKTNEPSNIVGKNQDQNITERTSSKPTTNSTGPYRGNKKFELLDLLDKTVMVAMNPIEMAVMNPNEVKRMRMRSTTVRPIDITPTTYRPRRRPTAAIKPIFEQKFDEKKTSIEDSRPARPQERNYRRRNSLRRKFTDEPILTTTIIPPDQATSEITTLYSTIPTTSTTTTTARITTANPTRTQSSLADESEVNSTESIGDEEIVALPTPASNVNFDKLSDFKPSPLWSIKSGEQTDFFGMEESNNSDDEGVKGHRQSRNAFELPTKLIFGFIPMHSSN